MPLQRLPRPFRRSGSDLAAVEGDQLEVEGKLPTYASSEHGRRQFCPVCGTGLFYINKAALPGMIDIEAGTLDDPEAAAPGAHIQTAERLDYVTRLADLPTFERYPG